MRSAGATRGDPTAPDIRAQQVGQGAGARPLAGSRELGTVVAFSTERLAATVRCDSGRQPDDVPLMAWPRERVTLMVGDRVVVDWSLGIPVIEGGFAAGIRNSIAAGVAEPREGASFREPGDFAELIPGDWSRTGDRGHGIHVSRGGLTEIGGPSARLRLSENSGFLDVTTRRMRMRSEWGDIWTDTVDGKTTLYLRGGSDQVEQNGGGKSRWTVSVTAGAAVDGFDLSVSDPDGRSAVRVYCGEDGTLETRCVTRVTSVGGDATEHVTGNVQTEVDGSLQVIAGGDIVNAAVGNFRVASTADVSLHADEKFAIRGRSLDWQSVEKALLTAGNGPVTGTAMELSVPHGDLHAHADLGNVSLRALAGTGEVRAGKTLTLEGRQKVSVSAAQVELAGTTSALPMWETFVKAFTNAFRALMIALQGGTVGTPAAQQIIGLPAAQVVMQQFLSSLSAGVYNSLKVRNG